MTTHKPKPPEGVQQETTANERYPQAKNNQEMHMLLDAERNRAIPVPGYGISDITAQVDAKMTPAVVAAQNFSDCQQRCNMLWGQYMAECDRLIELGEQMDEARDQAIKEAIR